MREKGVEVTGVLVHGVSDGCGCEGVRVREKGVEVTGVSLVLVMGEGVRVRV